MTLVEPEFSTGWLTLDESITGPVSLHLMLEPFLRRIDDQPELPHYGSDVGY